MDELMPSWWHILLKKGHLTAKKLSIYFQIRSSDYDGVEVANLLCRFSANENILTSI